MRIRIFLSRCFFFIFLGMSSHAFTQEIGEIECFSPPQDKCNRINNCTLEDSGKAGNIIDPQTGRSYFLDFPCDVPSGEKINLILNIHGAGSVGNWQRHYFPALDYVDDFNLVIATPTSLRDGPIPMWSDRDDEHLEAIVTQVSDYFGRENIRSFWLAGHSQGGMTSNRLVCSPFFRTKVDGWLSLSGGRIGSVEIPDDFFGDNPPPRSLTQGMESSGTGFGRAAMSDCDFSFIFATGEMEIVELPENSPWAEKYSCAERQSLPDIVDVEKGYVSAQNPSRGASWGRDARPGTSKQFLYPDCQGGQMVADIVRQDKGHTEGLEPEITRRLLQMMLTAPAGKISK